MQAQIEPPRCVCIPNQTPKAQHPRYIHDSRPGKTPVQVALFWAQRSAAYCGQAQSASRWAAVVLVLSPAARIGVSPVQQIVSGISQVTIPKLAAREI